MGLFVILFSLMSWQQYQNHQSDLHTSSLRFLAHDMASLQREMEIDFHNRDSFHAGQALTARGVNSQYQVLVATDNTGQILYATRLDLKGQQAAQALPYFDEKRFIRLQQNQRPYIDLDPDHQRITAYFPLTLARQPDEIRPSQTGTLFLVYDLSHGQAEILSQVSRTSFSIGLLLFFAMTALIGFLRRFVTHPIQDLVSTAQELAKGEAGTLTYIRGRGELARLGAVFNEMSQKLDQREAQRKRAEDALKKSQTLLTETGRMAKIGGWELDARTLEVSWTEETYRIHELPLGHKPPLEEAINFYHPDDRSKIEAAVQKGLEEQVPYDLELRFISAGGKHLWVKAQGQPVVEKGKTIKLFGTFQDITARKHAEEERGKLESHLRHNQKLEAIGTLAGGVAHEINNPITGIMNYAQLIQDRLDPQSTLCANLPEKSLERASVWPRSCAIFWPLPVRKRSRTVRRRFPIS